LTDIKAACLPKAYNRRVPSLPFTPAGAAPLAFDRPAVRTDGSGAAVLVGSSSRNWLTLAVGSLVVAGLLSLAVVVGRLPVLSRLIDDPLFFKRCLVVHVDLALVVWFYAFIAALLALGARAERSPIVVGAFALSVGGVGALLAGALVRGAQPILANYVPVIDHPLFSAGLTMFFTGMLFTFVHALASRPVVSGRALPIDAGLGLQAAALLAVVAATTWVSARAGLPDGVDAFTRAEFLAWAPGHVLQAANTAAMLGVWLWLLQRASGRAVLSARVARLVFGALVLPQCAMPLLTCRGTLDTLYHSGATQLMRWTIFPPVLAVIGMGLMHLRTHPANQFPRTPAKRAAVAGLAGSAGLALLGMVLGACIRGSTTLVPAHYHASLGAVTLAFMTAAFFICDLARRERSGSPLDDRVWRLARRQLVLFGVGQAIFALGFALGGAYGLGRKAYAAEQHVRSAGEITGLVVMGLGGLVAVAGGLWFLFLVVRELHAWWSERACQSPS
jgi:cytochrome c oxidase subunit 1